MNKRKIVIDMDDTSTKSTVSILSHHNKLTGDNVKEVNEWDGSDVFSAYPKHYIESLFRQPEMFDNLEFYEDAIETLLWLKERGYVLEMCTLGHLDNISLKIDFIKKHELDKIFDKFHFLSPTTKEVGMGKEFLDAWIVLDDNCKNLKNRSTHNILFEGDGNKAWNESWEGESVTSWKEFKGLVKFLESIE